ncbi:MAG: energy transducer TonB, partial [Alphaproteobacteria bacterium]|nr:energy transducer TonB [Alphaproteobacteria bacterium]
LDGIAAEAVRNWRFAPARRGAQAVASVVEVPIRFSLTDRERKS